MKTVYLLAFAVISTQAMAASLYDSVTPAQPVCYGREYAASTLAKNKVQSVKNIEAKLQKSPDSVVQYLEIEASVKNSQGGFDSYSAEATCDNNGHCAVTCDGGTVDLSIEAATGAFLLKNNGIRLTGCGPGADEVFKILKGTKGGDDIFRMYKLPNEFCKPDYDVPANEDQPE
jgi:hypothetical protein